MCGSLAIKCKTELWWDLPHSGHPGACDNRGWGAVSHWAAAFFQFCCFFFLGFQTETILFPGMLQPAEDPGAPQGGPKEAAAALLSVVTPVQLLMPVKNSTSPSFGVSFLPEDVF